MTNDPDLIVIIPSRGRPTTVTALTATFAAFCTTDVSLVFAVDDDDPLLGTYAAEVAQAVAVRPLDRVSIHVNHGARTMVAALNAAALAELAEHPGTGAIAFMGDDHRPRTAGWDAEYLSALDDLGGVGIVYGNDLLQQHRIPTQVAMTANIVRALGHMAPPRLTHLFVDNYWRDLGKSAGCLRYLPDVVVEHVHPFAGKAPSDVGYQRVNAPEMYAKDMAAYADYNALHMSNDVAVVEGLR